MSSRQCILKVDFDGHKKKKKEASETIEREGKKKDNKLDQRMTVIGLGNDLLEAASRPGSKLLKFSEFTGKLLTLYDFAKGFYMIGSATDIGKVDIFAAAPLYGVLFEASGEILNDIDKSMIQYALSSNNIDQIKGMINTTVAGRNSHLTTTYISNSAYMTMLTKGYFCLNEYKGGLDVLPLNHDDNNTLPVNYNGQKFGYLLVYPSALKEAKITQMMALPVK